MNAIKLPVHAYQMRNSTLWNLRAADNERLVVEVSEKRAKEIAHVLNVLPELKAVVRKLMSVQARVRHLEITSTREKINNAQIELERIESDALALIESSTVFSEI